MSTAAQRLDLRPDHWSIVRDVLRRHVPNRKVLAFGSRATWTAKEYSDLDLAILGDEPLSLDVTSVLAERFSDSDLPFKVDLVDWASTDETFRDIIRRDGVEVQIRAKSFVVTKQTTCSTMSSWPLTTIEEISKKVGMGPFGSSIKVETFVPDGVPIISGQHLHGSRVDDSDGYNFITEAHAQRLSNANVQRGDIVFTHAGNIGQVAYIPEDSQFTRYVISQRQFYMRCDHSKVIPEFVTAYFRSHEGHHKLLANSSQVGVPSIAQPVTFLRTIEIPLPHLREQCTIANILSTLDDKIELNRRMNVTLEALVRAIFKDWFVDFCPTHAKAEGRALYLTPEYWNLFPDALDRDGKPVGWRTGILSDVADTQRRSVGPTDVAENTPYIGLKHMPRRSIALTEWDGAGKVRSNKSVFKQGEFLFGKLSPCFHKVGFAPLDGICSTDIVIVVPRDPDWAAFTLACLSSDEFVDYTDRTSTGTIMSRTSWKTMGIYKICLPSEQVAQVFQNMVQPLLERVNENIHESHTLAQTRDILLPKLMSGEIRVDEAEAVEAATK